jgi:hypothetical protein
LDLLRAAFQKLCKEKQKQTTHHLPSPEATARASMDNTDEQRAIIAESLFL